MVGDTRWNHNIHYLPTLIDDMPEDCQRALDVGCGEGWTARALSQSVRHVYGIDTDSACIAIGRERDPQSKIEYLVGDFMTHPFPANTFDLVTCIAALHHMDTVSALERMRALLRPGGQLAVLGLTRSSYPTDLPRDLLATVVSHVHGRLKGRWESPAPVLWPPPHDFREIRSLVTRLLPGARVKRHLLWRYSILWTKPPRDSIVTADWPTSQ